jgi:hypothetical protein
LGLRGARAADSFLRATRADDESGSRQSARSEVRTNGLDGVEERRRLSEGEGESSSALRSNLLQAKG